MLNTNLDQHIRVVEELNPHVDFLVAIEIQPDQNLSKLLADLSPESPWKVRKFAAQKLGDLGNPEAIEGLLEVLPTDPLWMVRCTMIQALERIGNPSVIPTLQEVAKNDRFQIVRSYASKAVERLSPDL